MWINGQEQQFYSYYIPVIFISMLTVYENE